MDAKALEKIIALTSATTIHASDEAIPAVAVPEGMKLVPIERFKDRPARMRAVYETQDLADFCRYVAEHSDASTSVFLDIRGRSRAVAILDAGTRENPGWGEHRAVLEFTKTAAWQALMKACDKKHNQRSLIDYLEDWAAIIQPVHDGEVTDIPSAITAIRRVDIKRAREISSTQGDFSVSASAMESIEARSGKGLILPEQFDLTLSVYNYTRPVKCTVRMTLSASDDAPAFRLRVIGMESLVQQVEDDLEQEILDKLGRDVRVFNGHCKFQEVCHG